MNDVNKRIYAEYVSHGFLVTCSFEFILSDFQSYDSTNYVIGNSGEAYAVALVRT